MNQSRLWLMSIGICCLAALFSGCSGGGGSAGEPTEPTSPTNPTNPTNPTAPTNPTDPTDPTDPSDPSDPTDPDTVSLVPGHAQTVYVESLGAVRIILPDAEGDDPTITSVTVDQQPAVVGIESGAAVAAMGASGADADDVGVVVYLPSKTAFTATLTVSDQDDADQTVTVSVPETLWADPFDISGNVADGEQGAEVGVTTNINLLWAPLDGDPVVVESQTSDAAADGSFAFNGLVGQPSAFQVEVEGSN